MLNHLSLGTNGLGKETVLYLAAHNPRKIIFTGRKQTAADAVIAECSSKHPNVKVTFVQCDQASLSTVKKAAETILADNDRLDIVLAVAGIMSTPAILSVDGYELQFATNHLGHALLIKQLLPLLKRTAASSPSSDVRIVLYSSQGAEVFAPAGGIQFENLGTGMDMFFFGGWFRYGQSKLANILYAKKLAEHNPDMTITSLHPGVSWTGLVESSAWYIKLIVLLTSYWSLVPANECAWTGCWAATAPLKGEETDASNPLPAVESGTYYYPVGVKGSPTSYMKDEKLAEDLWQWTDTELATWMK